MVIIQIAVSMKQNTKDVKIIQYRLGVDTIAV